MNHFCACMIPWFQFTTVHIGLIPIQVWGFFVAFGIFCAAWVAAKKAARDGLSGEVIWDFTFWLIVAAFVGARLFEVVYEPAWYFAHPLDLLKFWQGGFSEMGGIIGAVVMLVVYFRKKKLDLEKYSGTIAYGLPLGLGIGRIGCFLIHDHPGTFTDFFLGVQYPDGIRHDHGLYLSIEGLLLFVLFVLLDQRKAKPRTFVSIFLIAHGIVRLSLDFLRMVDIRYAMLTPAQFVAAGMILAGIVLACYPRRAHKA